MKERTLDEGEEVPFTGPWGVEVPTSVWKNLVSLGRCAQRSLMTTPLSRSFERLPHRGHTIDSSAQGSRDDTATSTLQTSGRA